MSSLVPSSVQSLKRIVSCPSSICLLEYAYMEMGSSIVPQGNEVSPSLNVSTILPSLLAPSTPKRKSLNNNKDEGEHDQLQKISSLGEVITTVDRSFSHHVDDNTNVFVYHAANVSIATRLRTICDEFEQEVIATAVLEAARTRNQFKGFGWLRLVRVGMQWIDRLFF